MRAAGAAALLAALAGGALAQTVSFGGSFGADRALLVIDGTPRNIAVGATVQGVKLLRLAPEGALVEVGGQQRLLAPGGAQLTPSVDGAGAAGRIVMSTGPGGHHYARGQINGRSVDFMVDTGATSVSMGEAEATRLGIDFRRGERGMVGTANGAVVAHRVRLATVRVGDVTVYDVEALVVPAPMPQVLLGNSFLSRFRMTRDNDLLVLERRY